MMEPSFGLNWTAILLIGVVVAVVLLVLVAIALMAIARRSSGGSASDGQAMDADTALQAHQRLEKIGSQVERLEDALMDELKKE